MMATKASDKLLIQDSRTQKRYEIPIKHNTIPATAFKAIKGNIEGSDPRDRVGNGLRVYDPGLVNTAIVQDDATWVDTSKGQILYRGYSIEQLSDCEFEDIFHLMIWDNLPTEEQREWLRLTLATEMCRIPTSVEKTIRSFPRSTHPMPVLAAGLAAYIAAEPDSIPTNTTETLYHGNEDATDTAIITTLAAYAVVIGLTCSHLANRDFVTASLDEFFYSNLLKMCGNVEPSTGEPSPDVLAAMRQWTAITHDHGQANSTFALQVTASTLAHPASALISSLMSAYGPLHFGAQETAYRILQKLQTPENVRAYVERVKSGKERIHGFGHRTFKTVDIRVAHALQVLERLGPERSPLLPLVQELIRTVEADPFFQKRSLRPNGDIYGQLIFVAMGWGPEWSPALLFLNRMPGLMRSLRRQLLSDRLWLIRPADVFVGITEPRKATKVVPAEDRAGLERAKL